MRLVSRVILTVILSVIALPLLAQSWTYVSDRAIAPPSIAGDATGSPRVGGFAVVCFQGDWSLYLFSSVSPSGGDGSATIIVDGQRFDTRFDFRPPAADEGLILNQPIVDALKAGSRVEISFPSGTHQYRATFSLRGSARALSGVEANCAYPTPQNAPQRFVAASGESTPDAVDLARRLLADRLETMRQEASKPDIDVLGAWILELEDGWRFLKTDVGHSNFHFGISQFGTIVFAKPPDQDWQRILWLVSGATVSFDIEQRINGWPNIVLRNVRGVNQPYALWTWNGREYAHSRNIPYISQ